MTDERQKPYMVIEARYDETQRDNMKLRVTDSNIGVKGGARFHQMYDYLYNAAKGILAETRKRRLELRLTLSEKFLKKLSNIN